MGWPLQLLPLQLSHLQAELTKSLCHH
jgi:hypothetical protein